MEQLNNQVSNQPTSSLKGIKPIWLVLALILTAVIAGGAVYVWQSKEANKLASDFQNRIISMANKVFSLNQKKQAPQDETADWKIYRNDEYGFEMRYPSKYQEKIPPIDISSDAQSVIQFHYGSSNYFDIAVLNQPFDKYKLVDPPSGSVFRFDEGKNEWVLNNGLTTGGIFKKIDSNVLAYYYLSGDVKCSIKYMIVPSPKNFVVQIASIECWTFDKNTEDDVAPAFQFTPEQIMSTFKFTK